MAGCESMGGVQRLFGIVTVVQNIRDLFPSTYIIYIVSQLS
jgi:hypothetical protein